MVKWLSVALIKWPLVKGVALTPPSINWERLQKIPWDLESRKKLILKIDGWVPPNVVKSEFCPDCVLLAFIFLLSKQYKEDFYRATNIALLLMQILCTFCAPFVKRSTFEESVGCFQTKASTSRVTDVGWLTPAPDCIEMHGLHTCRSLDHLPQRESPPAPPSMVGSSAKSQEWKTNMYFDKAIIFS